MGLLDGVIGGFIGGQMATVVSRLIAEQGGISGLAIKAGYGAVKGVKPGFVKTAMTAGLKPPPFAGEPDQVARDVVRAMDKRKAVIYTPGMWRLVR